jgi:hypothetical protein
MFHDLLCPMGFKNRDFASTGTLDFEIPKPFIFKNMDDWGSKDRDVSSAKTDFRVLVDRSFPQRIAKKTTH